MSEFLPNPPDPGAASGDELGLDFTAGQTAPVFSLARIQVTPLIDTVLFLIWFYLLVGQLVFHQKDAAVELPAMASPGAAVEAPAEVMINLRQDGKITISGQEVKPEQLAGLLRAELAKPSAANETLRVVLRADRRQLVAAASEVLQRCREAGLTQVVFRAEDASR